MRSNLLTTAGVGLVLTCVVLLGGWKFSVGLLGVVLVVAGYAAIGADDES